MPSFVFCTKDCWPGVKTYLEASVSVLKKVYPDAIVEFFNIPGNGFNASLIHRLKTNAPDYLFIGGWDASMRNVTMNCNNGRTKVFLKWCSPLTQVDLGGEIPLFIDVVNFLQMGLIHHVSTLLEGDYNILKEIHSGFVYSPVCIDFQSMDANKINVEKNIGIETDLFCAPNIRKNIFNQIIALSRFENVLVHFNYMKPEYIEPAKRYLKQHKVHAWLPRNEYLHTIQRMDFGMQVSLSEGFNLTAAEHMYYGVPVVYPKMLPYADDSSIREFLAVDDPTNCSEIYEKIKWIVEHRDEAKALGESCRDVIVKSNDRNIDVLSNLFKEIIG